MREKYVRRVEIDIFWDVISASRIHSITLQKTAVVAVAAVRTLHVTRRLKLEIKFIERKMELKIY